MPDTPPVPIDGTFNSGAGTGTVEFDKALDQTVGLVPSDFARGVGFQRRIPTGAVYQSPTVIAFTGATANVPPALVVGWKYVPGAAPIKGINGLEVAAFEGVT